MKELNDLLEIVQNQTGASPIVAKFLLSIISQSEEVNIHILLTKVSSNNMEKMFNILVAMKKDTEIYFHIIDAIKKNEEFLNAVSVMEGL